MPGPWLVTDEADGVHVIPDDDLIVHRQSVHCFCAPVVELQAVAHWSHLWLRKLVCHRAMDGRD